MPLLPAGLYFSDHSQEVRALAASVVLAALMAAPTQLDLYTLSRLIRSGVARLVSVSPSWGSQRRSDHIMVSAPSMMPWECGLAVWLFGAPLLLRLEEHVGESRIHWNEEVGLSVEDRRVGSAVSFFGFSTLFCLHFEVRRLAKWGMSLSLATHRAHRRVLGEHKARHHWKSDCAEGISAVRQNVFPGAETVVRSISCWSALGLARMCLSELATFPFRSSAS
jgi:hypothetical protein